jgi:polyhydroxyalkanoate synthesis regulator phasin
MFIKTVKLTDPRRSIPKRKIADPKGFMEALNKMWDSIDEIYDFLNALDTELAIRFDEVPDSQKKARDLREKTEGTNMASKADVGELERKIDTLRSQIMDMASVINLQSSSQRRQ